VPANLNSKEIVNNFLYTSLIPEITNKNCPTKLNLLTSFKGYLSTKVSDAIKSEELAIRLLPDLIKKLNTRLDDWNSLGVPYPCWQSDENDELIITWKHPKYEEKTGYIALTENFINVLHWIGTLNSREFLIVCAVLLKTLGATKIFITDGPNDGGVDLIARIEQTPFNSLVFFVQSKTVQDKSKVITRDTVLMEYGKYLSLPHEEIYQKYRRALDLDRSCDGVSYCYTIIANSDFHNSAKDISAKVGVLLRSKIQTSYFLSHVVSASDLERIKHDLKDSLNADLSLNLSTKIML